jgi:hypothetical protein
MHWHIVKTLIHKEALRHLANRGGIALAMLLVVMALLMAAFARTGASQVSGGLIRSVQYCYIDYWDEGPWIEFLRNHKPESLSEQIQFRNVPKEFEGQKNVLLEYPSGVGAIQIRSPEKPGDPSKIWCWYPGEDRSVMAPFENWFWRTTRAYYRERLNRELDELGFEAGLPPLEADDAWVWRESHQQFLADVETIKSLLPRDTAADIAAIPAFSIERSALSGSKPIGTRTTISSALVLFALFFVCVYLLPSLTCEERERGVLLAQALSPASPLEILAAKLLFYPIVSIAFAAILGALTTPAVLGRPLFWLALVVLAFGSLGIGMTIACIAKTQRSASMTALCYMLIVSLLVIICQQSHLPILPQLILEYHGPRLLSAAITDTVTPALWGELGISAVLAVVWIAIAAVVFRKFGWQ